MKKSAVYQLRDRKHPEQLQCRAMQHSDEPKPPGAHVCNVSSQECDCNKEFFEEEIFQGTLWDQIVCPAFARGLLLSLPLSRVPFLTSSPSLLPSLTSLPSALSLSFFSSPCASTSCAQPFLIPPPHDNSCVSTGCVQPYVQLSAFHPLRSMRVVLWPSQW